MTVLWISAALAAVAFSLANTVRGETDRTSTELDEIRSYYLAVGAVDRAAIEVLWSVSAQGDRHDSKRARASVDYTFPTGVAHVELIPETAKLDVNFATPEQLGRMLAALGINPAAACRLSPGIVVRRGGGGRELSLPSLPSFPATTSFQEIEELLQVRGVTPEIFYGTYVPRRVIPDPANPRGAAQRAGGLPLRVRLARPGGRQYGRPRGAGGPSDCLRTACR